MKKTQHPLYRGAFLAAGALALAISAQAGLQLPYAPNADTLHLWHLNDRANQLFAQDSATLNPNTSPMTLTNLGIFGPTNTPPFGLADGTVVLLPPGGYTNCNFGCSFGVTEFNNLMGTCFIASNLNLSAASSYAATLVGEPDDTNPNNDYANPQTGAFTWEMLINIINLNPRGSVAFYLINGDNAVGTRGWQWRVDPGAQPQMELNGINAGTTAGGQVADVKPNIPVTGPDAIANNTWYHVAMTYTGTAPTNSDPTGVLTVYWTLLDPSRTNADVIGVYTNTDGFIGTGTPTFMIGGDARYITIGTNTQVYGSGSLGWTQANSPGLNSTNVFDMSSAMGPNPGGMAEVRLSDLCLKPWQMAFTNNGQAFAPVFISPIGVTTNMVGYGQPLSVPVLVSATPTVGFQWYFGGTAPANALAGQTSSTLSIPSLTFANGGSYYCVATNYLGGATSPAVVVTIGAIASELYPTGVDTNGQIMASPANNPDPHYTLIQSDDPNHLGLDALVWDTNQCPIAYAGTCGNGSYTANDGVSTWIGPGGNQGGSAPTDPEGLYTYRTEFVMDQANPATATLSLNGATEGEIVAIYLNGVSVGPLPVAARPGYSLYSWLPLTITNVNVLVPGINTLDMVLNSGLGNVNGSEAAFRCEPFIIGPALTNGTPVIIQQPVNQTVRDATLTSSSNTVNFSVVALSRPPLTYQWWADGNPIAGATARTLTYDSVSAPAPGTNFTVVVTGPAGSVSSSPAAVLTIIPSNQPPIAPSYTYYIYTNAQTVPGNNENLLIDTSVLLANATDPIAGIPVAGKGGASTPDGNALTITYDGQSTNGVSISSPNYNSVLLYNPTATGNAPSAADEFNYYISDAYGETATGSIYINVVAGPPASTVSQSGANIVLRGTGGAPLGTFLVLETTNLTTPFAKWKTNATGTFDIYGNYSISLPISSKSNNFYSVEWLNTNSTSQVPLFQVP